MRFEKGNKKIGFPEHFRFGIELEVNHTDTKKLYQSEESKKFFESVGYQPDMQEVLAHQGGAECVSGILNDSEQTWENLEKMCEHIKKYPDKNGNKPVADEKCGCHVHFDATELLQNPKMMENFKKLWVDSEELIYKMCNAENNPLRKSAINQELIPSINMGEPTLKNLLSIKTMKEIAKFPSKLYNNAVHVLIERRKGFASPSGQKILDVINKDKLKVSYKKYGKLQDKILVGMKADPRRYQGLNLANLSSRKKNTIEFRMANGSLDPEVIKQNVYLYGSLLNTAREMTLNPEYKKDEVSLLQRTDCTEEEKADRLLNVLFNDEEDKKIYKNRWKSVKDAPVFAQNTKKGFAKDRFVREDIKQVAEKTPLSKLQEAMTSIKEKIKQRENSKDADIAYEK